MSIPNLKHLPSSLEFKVIESKDGRPYLVFRFPQKTEQPDKFSYHYFVEVESRATVIELAGLPKNADIQNRHYNAVWNGEPIDAKSVKLRDD